MQPFGSGANRLRTLTQPAELAGDGGTEDGYPDARPSPRFHSAQVGFESGNIGCRAGALHSGIAGVPKALWPVNG